MTTGLRVMWFLNSLYYSVIYYVVKWKLLCGLLDQCLLELLCESPYILECVVKRNRCNADYVRLSLIDDDTGIASDLHYSVEQTGTQEK